MEHTCGVVVRLERLDHGARSEAETRQRGEDPAARDGFRLARRVADYEDVDRVRAAREAERDSAGDVQDRLRALRVLLDLGPLEHSLQVRVRVSLSNAQADARRIPARDDPAEEPRRDLVPDEQLDEPGIPAHAGHLDLKAREEFPRPKDVEPFRDLRTHAVASDEDFRPE